MSNILVSGWGAVSAAGWGVAPLMRALQDQEVLPCQTIKGPTGGTTYRVRTVPAPDTRPEWLGHPRYRRTSAISQYALAASLEALDSGAGFKPGLQRVGIVTGTHAACLRYSERFYAEALRDPATASPMLFPETVINAPASHLAAYFKGVSLTCSLIGDQTVFIQALLVGAEWLLDGRVDLCLVVSAEETAWPVADALRRFGRDLIPSEGAGAIVLTRDPGGPAGIRLEQITDAHLYARSLTKHAAAAAMRQDLPAGRADELLVDARCGVGRVDQAETEIWRAWPGPRLSPRVVLGEGLSAATAWQCVIACAALSGGSVHAANVSVVGGNQQAIGVRFQKCPDSI
jgi:3-oxoacyl-(acyl-carrier-protein) synthase